VLVFSLANIQSRVHGFFIQLLSPDVILTCLFIPVLYELYVSAVIGFTADALWVTLKMLSDSIFKGFKFFVFLNLPNIVLALGLIDFIEALNLHVSPTLSC